MKKLPAVVVAALLAFSLFTPVAFGSSTGQSANCCGCGEHGGYVCENGECVDGSKDNGGPSAPAPSSSASSESVDASWVPKRPPASTSTDDAGSFDGDAGAALQPCRWSSECPPLEICVSGSCQ